MKPAAFEYHAPATAEEAVSLLAEHGDSAKVLAGGQSLVPMLALRLTTFEHLVDVSRIGELRGIELRDGALRLGAATTQASIERSTEIATRLPLLSRGTPLIGHFQIRNRGTVGGSLAHADPAAEYPTIALVLDAQFTLQSKAGSRSVGAADFFTGLWSTALREDELLTAVTIPEWDGRCGFAIEEFSRRHGDFAIAGAAVALELGADDRIRRCHIGLLGLGLTPERAGVAEAAIVDQPAHDVDAEEIAQLAMSTLESVPSDIHGSSAYRRRVGAAVVAHAWRSARQEALGA